MLAQEHSYCIAIEKLINCKIPERAKYIRVIFAEITRILNGWVANWLNSYFCVFKTFNNLAFKIIFSKANLLRVLSSCFFFNKMIKVYA